MSPNKNKKGIASTHESSPDISGHRTKKRRLSSDEEDEDMMSPRKGPPSSSKLGFNGLRSPSFSAHNKPAELFRKDLISAMKMPDSDSLQQEEYILISDPWRQEWEKGVQVPVNTGEFNEPSVMEVREKDHLCDFKMPRKYLHASQDETYRQGLHELTGMQQLSEQVVRYDLDDLDVCWLHGVNEEREELGQILIHEWIMERIMEALEYECHEKMSTIIKTEKGLGIEYDEDILCDVCQSPDSEDTNEMVFCDGCDICVHQACYGIQMIPDGSWLCRTCALGIKPTCILCPHNGGAMKSTKSGSKWAHVSCALWIPEVSIGCVERMEPITKISNIPPSRWALVCCLCKVRVGACIQCSVKTCKTAFHVTCGFQHGLEMKTILDDSDNEDGVRLRAYCPKHTKKREGNDGLPDSPRRDRKDLTIEERENLRTKKLQELEESFYSVVNHQQIAERLQIDEDIVDMIYVYWKLKRKSNFDKPLLMPKTEEADLLEKQQEDSLLARMKMFVHLRQDLERVRNLCYMVSKREKMKRQYYKIQESVFMKQVEVLTDKHLNLTSREAEKIIKKFQHRGMFGLGDQTTNSAKNLKFEAEEQDKNNSNCLSLMTSDSDYPESGCEQYVSQASESMSRSEVHAFSEEEDILPKSLLPKKEPNFEEEEEYVDILSAEGTTSVTEQEDVKVADMHGRSRRSQRESVVWSECISPGLDQELNSSINETVEKSHLDQVHRKDVKERRFLRDSKFPKESEEQSKEQKLRRERHKSRENGKMSKQHDHSDRDINTAQMPFEQVQHLSHLQQSPPLSASKQTSRRFCRRRLKLKRRRRHSKPSSPNESVTSPVEFMDKLPSSPPTSLLPVEKNVIEGVKPDLNGLFQKSNLVVNSDIRDKVQRRLLKSKTRLPFMNGIHDPSQKKLEYFFKMNNHGNSKGPSVGLHNGGISSPSLTRSTARVLNEISPDKGKKPFENNVFGAHYTPRGSLSGYKIPKKSDSSAAQSTDPSDTKSPSSVAPAATNQADRPRSTPETRSLRRKIDGGLEIGVKKNIFGEFGGTTGLLETPDFRSLQKGVDVISNYPGYRSPSPLTVSTMESERSQRSESRESTPRRVTRSQLHDPDENSLNHSPRLTSSGTKIREGLIRTSQFSS